MVCGNGGCTANNLGRVKRHRNISKELNREKDLKLTLAMSLPTNLGLSARGVDRDAGNKSLLGTTAADNLNRLLEAFR